MLTRRTPMKRNAWPARPALERTPPVVRPLSRRGAYDRVDAGALIAVVKIEPKRSEAYRRAVAEMDCIACGVPKLSNHAHANSGKGKALKADDRDAFPLCVDRPGIEGCHTRHDQRRLIPGLSRAAYIDLEEFWARQTRQEIRAAGRWPANIEDPEA